VTGPRTITLLLAVAYLLSATIRAANELTGDLARATQQVEEALVRGDLERAMTIAGQAIEAHRQEAAAWILHAGAQLAARHWEEAVADCDEALRLQPKSVLALNHRGGAYLALKQTQKALADFDAALAVDPRNSMALTYRAQIRRLKGNLFRALDDANEAIQSDSNSAAAYTERAAIRAALGDVAAALEDCSSALLIGGLNEQTRLLRALLYMQQADYPHAREDFEQLLAGGSEFATPARIQLAWLLATCPEDKLRDGPRASRLAHEAIARATAPDATALDALGAASAELGDFASALDAAHQAIAATSPSQTKQLTSRRDRVALYLRAQPFRLPAPEAP
jgi:tetratricopeptide (TPR) repeat protein